MNLAASSPKFNTGHCLLNACQDLEKLFGQVKNMIIKDYSKYAE